ncbi:hypothetical protein BLA29_014772 [Euroglyphus maynei]|uniref:Uncharacterized protein n=1 Tax=Euroglyphus maynei TaxID=6958 RepID=A0A1Y3BII9_EURMA|nr:hypothetical protein BLA29_014772 [Euroglyphus maynei]
MVMVLVHIFFPFYPGQNLSSHLMVLHCCYRHRQHPMKIPAMLVSMVMD